MSKLTEERFPSNSPTKIDMEWHYIEKSQRKGPATEAEIARLLADGNIDATTQVWNTGLPDWQPLAASELAHLVTSSSEPPRVPGSQISNSLVWLLAFCPVVGGILTILLAPLAQGNESLLLLTPALNILVCYADERRLTRAGYNTAKLGGAWLIPVFLWKRASLLNQNKSYFWVWCAMLLLAILFF